MNKQILQMKYHPAKKEVEFHRFQSGNEAQIPKDSILRKYMNKRGSFVLQDHGNEFLRDIAKTFDGEKNVKIEVITTRNDFEDFMQMVEFYNDTAPNIRIDATLLSALPDMEHTYQAVKKHGEVSIGILERHKNKLFEVPSSNVEVKKCIENFAFDVQQELNSIEEKIEATEESNVNLCFAGVYSAGKSSLINAILGYGILPEAIKSETAKMYRIQSPKTGEKIRITFQVRSVYVEVVWDEDSCIFEFAAGPTESLTRENIQNAINKNSDKLQHIQINEILKVLNTDADVSDIKVFFPIPLDTHKVQFTIYDTPGTDSNYGSHQMVLKDALSEQTHSILIFVVAPTKTEGEGNSALLKYLKEAEMKDSKTSIDIGRSLFVMNFADSINSTERRDLQTAEIKYNVDEDFSIKLSDKKLFFASAKVSYAAKAKKKGIQSDDDDYEIDKHTKIADPIRGRYYQQNRCATSEYATKKLIDASTEALEIAQKTGDNLDILHICSGVYALENEIILYGEKFASAVKAFGIIDSVDKALSKMNSNAQSLERQNDQNINQINRELMELSSSINDSIKQSYAQHAIPNNAALPPEILLELHLDGPYIYKKIKEEPLGFIKKLLKKRFLGLGKVRFSEKHKQDISQNITSLLNDYTRDFLVKRQMLLEKQRNLFIETVKQIIRDNGKISDEAKKFILEVSPPKVKKPTQVTEFGVVYDSHKRTDHFLWIKSDYIDKESFMLDAEKILSDISDSVVGDFGKDYRQSLETILKAVESEFVHNLDKYSVLMKAKLEDKNAMGLLREKILGVTTDLEGCQRELEKLIWSVKTNEQ